jgi:cytochrome P450
MTIYAESIVKDAKHVPLLNGFPVIGVARQIHRNAMQYVSDTVRRYGHRVALRVLGKQVLLLSDPDDVEVVLLHKESDYGRSPEVKKLRPIFGDGLYSSEGERWLKQRRLVQPQFNHDHVMKYSASIVEDMKDISSKWQTGETRDILPEMLAFTTVTICNMVFGNIEGKAVKALADCVSVVFENLRAEVLYLSLWRKLPLPRSRRWNRAVNMVDEIVYKLIAARRLERSTSENLLDTLISATDENGETMSDQFIHDQVITMFLAGQETSAVALSWAIALLAQHRDLQEEAAEEIASVTNNAEVSAEDYPRLKFVHSVVQETLRLYPPLWNLGRTTLRNTTIRDIPVPAGTDIWIPVREIHRDPRWFSAPDQFNPHRWETAVQRPKFSYFPFGGGPRSCVAQHFLMAELVLGLAVLLSKFRFRLAPGSRIEPAAWLTLRPKNGVPIFLSARRPL